MDGDATLFTREDAVEAAWAVVDPVLKKLITEPALTSAESGAERSRRAY